MREHGAHLAIHERNRAVHHVSIQYFLIPRSSSVLLFCSYTFCTQRSARCRYGVSLTSCLKFWDVVWNTMQLSIAALLYFVLKRYGDHNVIMLLIMVIYCGFLKKIRTPCLHPGLVFFHDHGIQLIFSNLAEQKVCSIWRLRWVWIFEYPVTPITFYSIINVLRMTVLH